MVLQILILMKTFMAFVKKLILIKMTDFGDLSCKVIELDFFLIVSFGRLTNGKKQIFGAELDFCGIKEGFRGVFFWISVGIG